MNDDGANRWIEQNTFALNGDVVLLAGANSGIGYEATRLPWRELRE